MMKPMPRRMTAKRTSMKVKPERRDLGAGAEDEGLEDEGVGAFMGDGEWVGIILFG
jgi:hypothetical protein